MIVLSKVLLKPTPTPTGYTKLEEWKLLKSLICYEVGLFTLITASMNPSHAIGYSIPLTPFLVFSRPSTLWTSKLVYWSVFGVLFVFASPMGYACIQYIAMHLSGHFVLNRGAVLEKEFISFCGVLFDTLRDGYELFGAFSYLMLSMVYIPSVLGGVWISFMDAELEAKE